MLRAGDPPARGNAADGTRLIQREGLVNSVNRARTPAETLAQLRDANQRRARLIRNLRRVYGLGPRAIGELAIMLAQRSDALPLLEDLAQRFAERLDPDLLRALGGHEFLPLPIRVIARSEQ